MNIIHIKIDSYLKSKYFVFFVMLIMLISAHAVYSAEKTEYKIGEKLKSQKPNRLLSKEPYKNLNWEELSPADWDPTAPLKGLDLDKLEDSDPRARDALIAVGEAWKNAPIEPKLNGLRVRIAGFIVPLDLNRTKLKEFLLVPYFGACIHVPPPPSNQVVHAFNSKKLSVEENKLLKKATLVAGPITLIGTLETVHSSTSMGSAGYHLNIDTIEEYKEPASKSFE